MSSADQSIITIPSISEGTTDSDSTHPKIDLVIVTREEFETAVKPITDLVEATVYHTLQSWQQQQQQQQENEVRGEQEKDAAAVEEEEVDGFVRVRESPNLVVNGTSAVSDSHRSVVNVDSKAPCGTTANDASVGAVAVIDEVVLVGGSSRVPCVRAALRRALGKAGISAFAPHGPKELCTSLNPEEVVAEGLAVRGAVLSGVSTGKLKELLMMDCVNNAIGVMTWEVTGDITAGGAGSVSTPGTRIFNSVLHKGMAIPAKNTLRFPLADANQRFVSLDIFEEVEEVKRKKDISSSANPTNSGDASDFEITYAYNVVATADIAIPSSVVAAATDRDAVDITFTMTMDGVLQFTVVRVSGPSSGDNGTANINTSSVNMLIGYIVLMFALYLFVKIVLIEADVSSAIDSSFVNNVVAGAEHVCDSVSTVVDGQLNNAVVDAVGGLHV